MSPSRNQPADRSERVYRMLLVAYPADFRREYGDDLVQGFRDLMVFSTDNRGVWWRTTKDLVSSATRERAASLWGKRPSFGVLMAIIAGILLVVVAGPGVFLPLILIPPAVLVGLPAFGVSRFHRAWVIRRTTGGAVLKQIAIGLASFVPAVALLVAFGADAGYWIFVAVGITVIGASIAGILWAAASLVRSWRSSTGRRRWVLPVVVMVPSLAVLGFIIGASYNSYRQSLGPPGDHSVENASAETRALWTAAGEGRVDDVKELIAESCADPWVKFPVGNGRHNAKGYAEARELQLPDREEPPYKEISDLLGDYMDVWYDSCGAQGD